MKMTLVVATTAVVVCLSALAKSAAFHGPQSAPRSTADLGMVDEEAAGRRWWLAAVFTKRRSNRAAAIDPTTKNYYYYLQRQVADPFVLRSACYRATQLC